MSIIGDPLLIGSTGGGGSFVIIETPDPAGGTVMEIIGTEGKLQSKSVSPTESAQTVTPDTNDGYIGLTSVSVGAISSTYIGSGITQRDDTDLSASGATVTVPSGYYANTETKSVATGTAGTPTATKGVVSSHSVAVTPSVTNVTGYITGGTKTGTAVTVSASELVSGTKSITSNGTSIDVTNYAAVDVAVPTGTPTLQTKSVSFTPTESAQSQTVTPDAGYDGLDEVDISVSAISSSYVGSGITRRDSTSLSASGATVSVPAGYYENNASKAVASGSATTPATTISVTPNVQLSTSNGKIYVTVSGSENITPTVSAGYVSTGTSGTVSVSGSVTAQLTTQAAQTFYPSTSDQTITSDHYLTGTQTFKAVAVSNTLTAANVKNGVTITIGDSADADRIMSVTGTYTGGGSVNVQTVQSTSRTSSTTYTSLISLTCSTAGTYDVYWTGYRSTTSGTSGSQLYLGGTAYGSANTTFTNNVQTIHLTGVSISANQSVAVYGRARGSNYYMYVSQLTIVQTA